MKVSGEKILFIDSTHHVLVEKFEKSGFKIDYFPEYGREDYLKIVHNYTGIIIRSKIILDKDILGRAVKLRFIGRVGSGLENIDRVYADKMNIQYFNSPEGSRDAVGEHAVGLLIALMRKIVSADGEVRHRVWNREGNRGHEIRGKAIGIIGYGNMGSAFAEKISGFGARVIAYDKYKSGFGSDNVEEIDMEAIFQETDILSLHVPLTLETEYLVNSKYLGNFRKNIFLLNTSRGKVVNSADLVAGIKSGKILGAALDVIEYEDLSYEHLMKDKMPAPFEFLARSDRVVLSPHVAGWTYESHNKLAVILFDKIKEAMGF